MQGETERRGPRRRPARLPEPARTRALPPRGRRRHSPSAGARPRAAAASPASGRRSMKCRRRRPWGRTSQHRASPLPPEGLRQRCAGRLRPRRDKDVTAPGPPAFLGGSAAPRVAALAGDVGPHSGKAGVESAVTGCSARSVPLLPGCWRLSRWPSRLHRSSVRVAGWCHVVRGGGIPRGGVRAPPVSAQEACSTALSHRFTC